MKKMAAALCVRDREMERERERERERYTLVVPSKVTRSVYVFIVLLFVYHSGLGVM